MDDKDIKLICGDCLQELKRLDENSIDMIFTSPPYADKRKNCYQTTTEQNYLMWFFDIALQLKRVLKSTGSFFLNIKSHVRDGERSLYVYDLVTSLKRQVGFNFVDEFCWIKQAFPGGMHGRFKNAFEPVFHFVKGDIGQIVFNPLACGKSIKPESFKRNMRKASEFPVSGSGMNKPFAGEKGRNRMLCSSLSRPTNVIVANNIVNQHMPKKDHPAVFPEKLVEFFVKSFSNTNDIVLDPFMGSGTTGKVCKDLGRKFIGIDIEKKYCQLAKNIIFR